MNEWVEGDVEVDGVSSSSISLRLLRRRIAYIPQDPVIFTGTIRRNMDPFGHHNDERLHQVLQAVQLNAASGSASASSGDLNSLFALNTTVILQLTIRKYLVHAINFIQGGGKWCEPIGRPAAVHRDCASHAFRGPHCRYGRGSLSFSYRIDISRILMFTFSYSATL